MQTESSMPKPGDLVRGKGRTHIRTELMRESLVSHQLASRLDAKSGDEVALLPWAKLINIGGSSILDRGSKALLPLLDEILKLRAEHPMLVSVGGGARLRHTFEIALDLGLPIGGLAQIAGAVEEQNAHVVHALLSQHGGVSMCREHFVELPKYLLTGMIPIVISMPPYHFWEPPPAEGVLPENGSDLGAFMTAEVLGVSKMVFVKDQDGQLTKNPNKHSDAKHQAVYYVKDLLNLPQEDLIIERAVLDALNRARHVREIHVINGLVAGNLTKAFNNEQTGTVIKQDVR